MSPSTAAEAATPISTAGSGTARTPSTPPNDMTRGNVSGSSQMAGVPSCVPQMPTATIASR